MTPLARRMQTLAAIEISLALIAAILASALLAFGLYVRTLTSEMTASRAALVSALSAAPSAQRDARAGGTFAASRYIPAGVEVVLLDAASRVTVFRSHRADSQAVVNVRARGNVSGDPKASGAAGRFVLTLATAFGLQQLYAHVGNLYIIVKSNDAMLAATMQPFVLPMLLALCIAVACGLLIARALTQQALHPLDAVTAALERFASGDLTPQPIAADERHQLASLATAYNGAIAQMQRAFAARDRANASMRQFIADAGHQLRTPLTVVQGFIAILRRARSEHPGDRERILDTMSRQSRIMGALIDKLILLEHWESLTDAAPAEPIDVGVLVSDLVTPIADANPQRDVSIEAESGVLAAIDPIDLGYVVNNLVDNALKYASGQIGVNVRGDDGSAIVEVADEGPGIAPDDAAHVFDRFYRGAQRDVEGSGLGLAIAKAAVERARGTISLQSEPQHGSCFTVRLPRASANHRWGNRER